MKTYSIHSGLSKGRSIKSGWLVPADYDFWEPLVTYFIRKCTHFRIDCWIGETTAIERAKVHGENLDLGVNNMKAFTGEITDQFISELIHDPFDDEGKIKWFSIFLIKDDRILFLQSIMAVSFLLRTWMKRMLSLFVLSCPWISTCMYTIWMIIMKQILAK